MFLDWLLSPIADKNTPTGAILDNYCKIKKSRREEVLNLERRKVEALEKLALNHEDQD